MSNILPTGAYIIYNRDSDKAVTVKGGSLALEARDESRLYEEQIWWVERCPECDNFDTYPKYLITNLASNKRLSVNFWSKTILLNQCSGGKEENWDFMLDEQENDTPKRVSRKLYYSSFPGSYWHLACTAAKNGGSSLVDISHEYSVSPKYEKNLSWEFIEPNTKFPAGWFEIENMFDGVILGQTYLTSPPILVENPIADSDLKLPMYRERWATQWKISRSPAHSSTGTENEDKDPSWVIENRLTGGMLGCPEYGGMALACGMWAEEAPVSRRWILEFHGGETSWRVRNLEVSTYLEAGSETVVCGNTVSSVVCTSDFCRRSPDDKRKKWSFRNVHDHLDA